MLLLLLSRFVPAQSEEPCYWAEVEQTAEGLREKHS